MSSQNYGPGTFSCAIRGYHVYTNIWQPEENETLQYNHESDNCYDLIAIKMY